MPDQHSAIGSGARRGSLTETYLPIHNPARINTSTPLDGPAAVSKTRAQCQRLGIAPQNRPASRICYSASIDIHHSSLDDDPSYRVCYLSFRHFIAMGTTIHAPRSAHRRQRTNQSARAGRRAVLPAAAPVLWRSLRTVPVRVGVWRAPSGGTERRERGEGCWVGWRRRFICRLPAKRRKSWVWRRWSTSATSRYGVDTAIPLRRHIRGLGRHLRSRFSVISRTLPEVS